MLNPFITPLTGNPQEPTMPIILGGYAALAESAWMGVAQASEVLTSLRPAPGVGWRMKLPRWPRLHGRGQLTRQFSAAEASLILMVSFLLAALLGALRQVLFNAYFGAGMEASAFYAAFRLPDVLFSLVAGTALASALIPVLLNTVNQQGEQAGAQLINRVLSTLLLLFAGLILLFESLAPWFVRTLLAPGFDAATSQLTVTLTRIMLVQPLLLVLGSLISAVLNSRDQFLLTSLALLSHNLGLIGGILLTALIPSLGIYGPAVGVVGGALLQLVILMPGWRALGLRFRWQWPGRDPGLRQVLRLLIPNGLSVGVSYGCFVLDTAFATLAAEPAALAADYNAWLLVGLMVALIGQAIGQAIFPRLALHAEAADWPSLRRTVGTALFWVIGAALVALLLLISGGRATITFLFELGQFDAADGDLTYRLLVLYALGLPAYVSVEVLTGGLLALRDARTPLFTNVAQLALRALILTLLIEPLGVQAIPLAFISTAFLEALTLGVVLWRTLVRFTRSSAYALIA